MDWVANQQQGVQSVGQSRYLQGVRTPKRDPIQAGIAAQPAYDAAMSNPTIRARRVTALQRTNMNEWAAITEAVGPNRYVEGSVAARPKLERGVARYRQFLEQHVARLDSMPSTTSADRTRKMVENLEGLRKFKEM